MSEYSYSDFSSVSKSFKPNENFKGKLINILREKGVVDRLKTQVRQNLISEMAVKESIFKMKNNKVNGKTDEIDIFLHASLSVIAEFFSNERYPYSHSVFVPETGLSVDKFYGLHEMLRILQIDTESEFSQKLKGLISSSNKGFLWCLLKTVSDYHTTAKKEIHIQTEKAEKFIPISEKIQKLDWQFEDRQKEGILKNQQIFEDRMISYQKELEKRLRQEMDIEIERFKNHEISMLKIKEEGNMSKLLKQKSKSLEEEYQNRLTALKERERTSQENMQRLLESQERENYLQRQQLIRDINNIREKELQNKKERDRIEREFQMMKDQHKLKLDDLEKRNSVLKCDEMEHELKIQQEINKIRLDEESRLVYKWKEIEVTDAKLKEDQKYLSSEKEIIEKLKQELLRKQILFKEMEIISYPALKDHNQTFQNQIEELKQQLQHQIIINEQDKHKIDCLIKQKLGPNFEQQVLTNELDRARDIFKREKNILEEQKEILEKKLLEEIKQKRLLTDQYSQQQDLLESLTRQYGDMKDFSYRNRQGYQSNRSPGNMYNSARISTNRDNSPHSYSENRQKNPVLENNNDDCNSTQDLADFTSDAKHRLLCLDEETEQVHKTYQHFKNRLANSSADIDDIKYVLPTNLVSESFKSGLQDGRKLNMKNMDNFQPSNFTINEIDNTFKEPNNYWMRTILPDLSTMEMEKDNNVSAILNPLVMQRLSPEYSRSEKNNNENFVQINDNKFENIDNLEEDNKSQKPLIEMNDQNINSDSDDNASNTSNVIVLNKDWQQSKDQNIPHSIEIAKGNVDDQVDDDPEIDPVIKQYMELIKKKKETQQATEIEALNVPYQPTNLEEDISDDIKTESLYSADVLSDKKENSERSETDAFW